jgi:uracil-DNA glycosylase family 4
VNHHPQSEVKTWQPIRVADCVRCSLHQCCKTVCLVGDGPVPCDAVILGEAPGETEDENEIPFCGKSGVSLRRMLKEIGIDPREVYFANVVGCRPPANRTPKKKEADICSQLYLRPQLDAVNPKVILLLRNTAATWALGKKSAVKKIEGSTFSLNGYTCVPSRHPSSLRFEKDAQKKFRENLLLFKRTLNPPKDGFI